MSLSKIKFTPEQAKEIREKYATGNYYQYELAEEYFVKQSVISRIINFKDVYKL